MEAAKMASGVSLKQLDARWWAHVCDGCGRVSARGYRWENVARAQAPKSWKRVRVLGVEEHYCGACQRKGA